MEGQTVVKLEKVALSVLFSIRAAVLLREARPAVKMDAASPSLGGRPGEAWELPNVQTSSGELCRENHAWSQSGRAPKDRAGQGRDECGRQAAHRTGSGAGEDGPRWERPRGSVICHGNATEPS